MAHERHERRGAEGVESGEGVSFSRWGRGKDCTMCTAAKTYEIGQNRLKLAE